MIAEVLEGKRMPIENEIAFLAKTVHCLPEDLTVTHPLSEPVIVRHKGQGAIRENQTAKREGRLFYTWERLASSEHHSLVKAFELTVHKLGEQAAPEFIQVVTHCFYYAYHPNANVTVKLLRKDGATGDDVVATTICTGDSFYVQPNVAHALVVENGGQEETANFYAMRIPGQLTKELQLEVSICDKRGRNRIGNETSQWYN